MAFVDKVFFVAGGCGVVGSGIVQSLLQEGANVVVNSRSANRLDDLHNSIPAKIQRRLTTIQEDCGTEDGVRRIKDFVIKEFGKVNHVVTSIGSAWQKGVLTDQSLEEFQAEVHNGAATHFLVTKVFLPCLTETPGASFTYITGVAGEKCFDRRISLLTVKTACLYGVVEAARAQCQGGDVAVIEVRIAIFVQPAADSTFKSNANVVGSDYMGRVCTSIIKRRPPEVVRVTSRDQMAELLKM